MTSNYIVSNHKPVNITLLLTQLMLKSRIIFLNGINVCPLYFLTLSEPASSGLLSDFQPVLPLGPFSLQTGATAAASLPQVATICCATLPALPSRRWTLNAHW